MGWKFATPLLVAFVALASSARPASAAWLGASDLASANPADKPVGEPSIAMARDGTAYAAFQHFDGTNYRAGVAVRAPGGGFGPVQDLSPAGQDAFSPVVAVDRQGNATLAWEQGPAFVVEARVHPAGGDWGAMTPLSAGPIFNGPSLAAGENGGAVVAWTRNTGGFVRVEAAIRPPNGTGFGPALLASPAAGTGMCQPPHVAIDAAGDVAAIWTRRTSGGGDYHVESAVKAAGAAAFDTFEARSPTSGNSDCDSDVQMTRDGRVTAMWDFTALGGASNTFYADRGAPFASGAWSPAATLAPASTRPLFALDDAGNAAATWLSSGQIVSAVRSGLGGFSPGKALSGATDLKGQAVAAAPNGDALAAYVGMSNGNDAVFGARRRAGADFGDVSPVATTPPGGATVFLDSPAVALDDQGDGFAAWEREVSGPNTFTAQVAAFDPVPPAITAADVPATATAGQAVGMSAAATDRMSAPALHFDFGDGSGADGGAVQHLYAAPGAYTVTVTATDAAGNAATAARAIQVAPAPAIPRPAPPPPATPAGPQPLTATTAASWDRLKNGRTRLRALKVEGLAGPETVQLACATKRLGCRKAMTRKVTKHGKSVSFAKQVKGVTLRPKAVLTITVTRPDHVARVFTYTMVAHRDPKKATRCVPPGVKRPVAC
ncbi:PKD domain-containing protein [Solirubrobacter ginsenosidimutans]|uniref:PKD domain-containing protein n=1 Tax=Solirubrobacter ginsenosidimutans TaxID=490573 RepID=A0A9X3MSU7_9ACTN|nr:PKD domain-containing protein [Solirubrobacter ginsenosidimutans]MDA0161216.1 PKD domain-containing protein [Solirubrobacter ginsenosidimutans]